MNTNEDDLFKDSRKKLTSYLLQNEPASIPLMLVVNQDRPNAKKNFKKQQKQTLKRWGI